VLLSSSKRLRELAGALETANLLLVKLLIKKPSAARSFPGLSFRGYMSLVGDDRWKSRPIEDVLPPFDRARIVIEHVPGGGIATPLDELAYLGLITRTLAPKRIFEIGTFRGRTALNFALNSPPDCVVYTLDLPEGTPMSEGANPADREIRRVAEPGIDYASSDVAEKIKQLFGDSTVFDFEPYAGTIDIVFVDGAHHYAAARSDSVNAVKIARPGGVVIWHDFANYGDYNDVTRAVLDTVPGEAIVQLGSTQLALHKKPRSGSSDDSLPTK